MHRSGPSLHAGQARARPRTWQTSAMRIMRYLLGSIGFSISMRRLRILARIRDLVTLALIMSSVGTAVGYALARRGATSADRDE